MKISRCKEGKWFAHDQQQNQLVSGAPGCDQEMALSACPAGNWRGFRTTIEHGEGGSVRLQHAEHHLVVRPGCPTIPITTSSCFPELPPCLFLLPVRSLRVKAQMTKHTRLQHFVAPQIPHITPLHLASQLNTNCSQNSSSAVPTDAPVPCI